MNDKFPFQTERVRNRVVRWVKKMWRQRGFPDVLFVILIQLAVMTCFVSMTFFTRMGDHQGPYIELFMLPCSCLLIVWLIGMGMAIAYRRWVLLVIQLVLPFTYPFGFELVARKVFHVKTWEERRWEKNQREWRDQEADQHNGKP